MKDKRARIIIFSGTTEGRQLSEELIAAGIPHMVSVATAYGEFLQKKSDLVRIEEGRKDREEMEALFAEGTEYVVDATHPFATEVTENLRAAAGKAGVRYLRVLRETGAEQQEGVTFFSSVEDCAAACGEVEGNLLLTTGSKELPDFCGRITDISRIYARVLPSAEGIDRCSEAGIRQDHIIALQGPFSEEMNLAMIRQYKIACLVTKESGTTGGADTKFSACRSAGIPCFCIRRPGAEEGMTVEEAFTLLQRGIGSDEVCFHLIGAGMGSPEGLTAEALSVLRKADVCFGAERLLDTFSGSIGCLDRFPYFRAKDILDRTAELRAAGKTVRQAAVLFSGDIGFFSGAAGFARNLEELKPKYEEWFRPVIKRYPGISCVSFLSARLGVAYSDAEILSLHGRSDGEVLADAVRRIREREHTFMLFSGGDDVARLAKALQEAGCRAEFLLGKDLSYPEESIRTCSIQEALQIRGKGLYTALIRNPEPLALREDEAHVGETPAAGDAFSVGGVSEVGDVPAAGDRNGEDGGTYIPVNRLLIAAPKSGSGKTLVTCGLLRLLQRKGVDVTSFKCGPDYIDPMFHKRVLGISGGNLDTFFCSREKVREILGSCGHTHAVLEGVMGIYDGLGGLQRKASCYEVAAATKTPVLLLVDGRGSGRTLLSVIRGILREDEERLIRGIILNRISEGFYGRLAGMINEALEAEGFGARVLGFLPELKEVRIDSRHLGLLRPEEIPGILEMTDRVADMLEKCCDIPEILKIMEAAVQPVGALSDALSGGREERAADKAEEVVMKTPVKTVSENVSEMSGETVEKVDAATAAESMEDTAVKTSGERKGERLRLAVALDEAFCFYYQENLRLFERLGAEIIFFSPIHDEKLPENISGIYLGGGYPELYPEALSGNLSMRENLRRAISSGVPSLAECGGFMYLHEWISDAEGKQFPMAGVLPGGCVRKERLQRFGYVELERMRKNPETPDGQISLGIQEGVRPQEFQKVQVGRKCLAEALEGIRGHEFHYYDSTDPGKDMLARKAGEDKTWPAMHVGSEHVWGFPHLYLESNPTFAECFVEVMRHGRGEL